MNNSFQDKTILIKSFQNNGIDLIFHFRQKKRIIHIKKIDREIYKGNRLCIEDT